MAIKKMTNKNIEDAVAKKVGLVNYSESDETVGEEDDLFVVKKRGGGNKEKKIVNKSNAKADSASDRVRKNLWIDYKLAGLLSLLKSEIALSRKKITETMLVEEAISDLLKKYEKQGFLSNVNREG